MYLLCIQNRLSSITEEPAFLTFLAKTDPTLLYKSIQMLFTGFAEKKTLVFLISPLTVTFYAVISLNTASMAPFPAILWWWMSQNLDLVRRPGPQVTPQDDQEVQRPQ